MTRARDDLPPAYVSSVLDYHPDRGEFFWRHRVSKLPQWNGKFSGQRAGTINDRGYEIICIDGKDFRSHRLAWVIMTGSWPTHEIDHRNLKKADNRWPNLREATHAENNRNRPAQANNKSGYKGVSYCQNTKMWIARIKIPGKSVAMIVAKTPNKNTARIAYQKAAEQHHGAFARVDRS